VCAGAKAPPGAGLCGHEGSWPRRGSNGRVRSGVRRPPLPDVAGPRCYTPPPMSKVCASCGKKPSFGNNRSHSMVATKRRFNPNLQRVRVLLNGVARRAYVCTKCLKAGKVQKAV
jgi:large subunit ribosomal protein L28